MNLIKTVYLIRESNLSLHGDFQSEDSGVFVVGCGRSGTTLLRRILQVHPNLSSGYETHFFTKLDRWYQRYTGKSVRTYDWDWLSRLSWKYRIYTWEIERMREESGCLPEFAQRFFREYLREEEDQRWVEKTPGHVNHIPYIHDYFPRAKFVHILRDPRDTVSSLKNHPKWDYQYGQSHRNTSTKPVADCLDRWVKDVSGGLVGREYCPDHYLEVHYEDLIRRTEETLREILDFIGEPWSDKLLSFHEVQEREEALRNVEKALEPIDDSSLNRWQEDLSGDEIEQIRDRATDLASRIGYEL